MTRNTPSRLILAIETSAPRYGAALAESEAGGSVTILAEEHLEAGARRGENLTTSIERVLSAAGRHVEDLSALAAVTGPGSYTGLRAGLALIRGLALVDRLPVVPVGSLELVARAAPRGAEAAKRICALLDASGGKVYAAGYVRSDGAAGDEIFDEQYAPTLTSAVELARLLERWGGSWVVYGDRELRDLVGLDREVTEKRAGVLARIGAERLARGAVAAAERVLPLYVGASVARPNRNRVAPVEALSRGPGGGAVST